MNFNRTNMMGIIIIIIILFCPVERTHVARKRETDGRKDGGPLGLHQRISTDVGFVLVGASFLFSASVLLRVVWV